MEMMLLIENNHIFSIELLCSVTLLIFAFSFRLLLQYGTGSPRGYEILTFSLAFLG